MMPPRFPAGGWFCGTGRRKRSVARVFLRKAATNKLVINGTSANEYFNRKVHIDTVMQPLAAVQELVAVIKVNVYGGGHTGQAGAIGLGISRAIINSDINTKQTLSRLGLTTRDPREVERKKVGQHKARKKKQFSKR